MANLDTSTPLCRRPGHCALCGAVFTATNPEGPLKLGGQQYGTCLDCARMVQPVLSSELVDREGQR